ncbi:hypothetical protein [Caulobacter endophyticus]|uniref:Uncharacterized protein n=1 Tax=Caulobacter endophyticus TaxID=2172652 RepID=A0A2T9K3D0_9CAUL|nr:hypothetical protein [Caulobacter endophyticus]PVM90313.1 hypothetical protein DDF67_10320 [Caulobacter endophyticus]
MFQIAATWIAMAAMATGFSSLYYIAYASRYDIPADLYTRSGAAMVIVLSGVVFTWGLKTLGKAFPGVTFKSYAPILLIGAVVAGLSFPVVKRQAFTLLGLGYFETALALLAAGTFIMGAWFHLEILHFRKTRQDHGRTS